MILLLALAMPFAGAAQDRDLERLYEKYRDVKGFDFERGEADLNMDVNWDFGDFLNNLSAFYILEFDYGEGNRSDLASFESKFYKLLDKKNFITVLELESDGKLQIYRREDADEKATDYILVAGGDNDISFIWAAGK